MKTTIYERRILSATNTDILSTGRLNAIPYTGLLTIRLQSQLADATNSYAFTIQLPGGEVPVDTQLVPACNPAIAGVIDERTVWQATYPAPQGGHFVVSVTETGTAVLTAEFILRPL